MTFGTQGLPWQYIANLVIPNASWGDRIRDRTSRFTSPSLWTCTSVPNQTICVLIWLLPLPDSFISVSACSACFHNIKISQYQSPFCIISGKKITNKTPNQKSSAYLKQKLDHYLVFLKWFFPHLFWFVYQTKVLLFVLKQLFCLDFVIKVSSNCCSSFSCTGWFHNLSWETIFYLCQQKEIRKIDHTQLLNRFSVILKSKMSLFFLCWKNTCSDMSLCKVTLTKATNIYIKLGIKQCNK